MIFESEVDRGQITKGLVGSQEVVFDEPLGELQVEQHRVIGHVAEAQEFVLEGPVETLVHGIVLRRLRSGPIMLQTERCAGGIEMPVELASVVRLDVLDLAVEKDMKPPEEISCAGGAVGRIHREFSARVRDAV